MQPNPSSRRRVRSAWLAPLCLLVACSGDGSSGDVLAGATATSAPATTAPPTTAAPAASSPSTTAGRSATTTAPGTTPATTRPAAAAPGATAIEVASTTSQYFVLFVKPDLKATLEVPVAIARGKAGTTVLTDGRAQLATEHYRVATFSVDKPGDVDGDGIDDLTELADAKANPLNPAPKMDDRTGAVIIPDAATFADLSYQGANVGRDAYLAGLEFMKFLIVGTNTAHPAVYFMNTNTYNAHPVFATAVGLPGIRGPSAGTMRGDIVFNPDGIAPDGSKGTYRFAFQPSDAYSFAEIALAYELLESSMPMMRGNLLYYPFPQSALPLYRKEKALYDAYRVPVLVE